MIGNHHDFPRVKKQKELSMERGLKRGLGLHRKERGGANETSVDAEQHCKGTSVLWVTYSHDEGISCSFLSVAATRSWLSLVLLVVLLFTLLGVPTPSSQIISHTEANS